EQAEFQIMLSGCEYLKGGEILREELEKRRGPVVERAEDREPSVDLFWTRVLVDSEVMFWNESVQAPQPRIFRTGSAWRYQFPIHETPVHPTDKAPLNEFLHGVVIEHVVDDPEARFSSIWEKHIPVLKALLQFDPNDARSLIFLAQSYEALMFGF